jgi:hypothetical protein
LKFLDCHFQIEILILNFQKNLPSDIYTIKIFSCFLFNLNYFLYDEGNKLFIMKTYKRLKPNIYNITQKKRLANQLQNISKEDAIQDFERLKQIHCNAQKKGLSRIGNKVVDYFTLTERLNTRGNKGISFYDLLYNKLL